MNKVKFGVFTDLHYNHIPHGRPLSPIVSSLNLK